MPIVVTEKQIVKPNDVSVFSTVNINGRLFACPREQLNSLVRDRCFLCAHELRRYQSALAPSIKKVFIANMSRTMEMKCIQGMHLAFRKRWKMFVSHAEKTLNLCVCVCSRARQDSSSGPGGAHRRLHVNF